MQLAVPLGLRVAVPLAVALHKLPEGIALGGILRASVGSRKVALGWAVLAEGATLAGGALAVSEAAGIFPDGLLFDAPGSDPAPPGRSLAGAFDADQESLEVSLTVPRYREMGINVAPIGHSSDARYRAEYAMVRDENTGLAEKPVQVARKNLRLLFEGEPAEGQAVLSVARVKRTPAGLFELDPRHVPPLLEIHASDYLVTIVRRLVEILAARSSSLAGTRRQKNQSLADFTASDIANFWLLYSINAHFPVFRHMFETSGGHPESLYSAMLSLAGCLTTFSLKIHPRDLPDYDHDNLGKCSLPFTPRRWPKTAISTTPACIWRLPPR